MQWLYGNGRLKVFGLTGKCRDIEVIEEAAGRRVYWVKFSYTNDNGNTVTDIEHVRLRWKPWEYYFDEEAFDPMDEEAMRKYLKVL